jgi:hypothetical protein
MKICIDVNQLCIQCYVPVCHVLSVLLENRWWLSWPLRTNNNGYSWRQIRVTSWSFSAITLNIIISVWQPPHWFVEIYQRFGDRLRLLHQDSDIRLACLSHMTLLSDPQYFIVKIPILQTAYRTVCSLRWHLITFSEVFTASSIESVNSRRPLPLNAKWLIKTARSEPFKN